MGRCVEAAPTPFPFRSTYMNVPQGFKNIHSPFWISPLLGSNYKTTKNVKYVFGLRASAWKKALLTVYIHRTIFHVRPLEDMLIYFLLSVRGNLLLPLVNCTILLSYSFLCQCVFSLALARAFSLSLNSSSFLCLVLSPSFSEALTRTLILYLAFSSISTFTSFTLSPLSPLHLSLCLSPSFPSPHHHHGNHLSNFGSCLKVLQAEITTACKLSTAFFLFFFWLFAQSTTIFLPERLWMIRHPRRNVGEEFLFFFSWISL